jgi:hypothetical protein
LSDWVKQRQSQDKIQKFHNFFLSSIADLFPSKNDAISVSIQEKERRKSCRYNKSKKNFHARLHVGQWKIMPEGKEEQLISLNYFHFCLFVTTNK